MAPKRFHPVLQRKGEQAATGRAAMTEEQREEKRCKNRENIRNCHNANKAARPTAKHESEIGEIELQNLLSRLWASHPW